MQSLPSLSLSNSSNCPSSPARLLYFPYIALCGENQAGHYADKPTGVHTDANKATMLEIHRGEGTAPEEVPTSYTSGRKSIKASCSQSLLEILHP